MDRAAAELLVKHMVLLEHKLDLQVEILRKEADIRRLEKKYYDDPQHQPHRDALERAQEDLRGLQRKLRYKEHEIALSHRDLTEVP